MLLALLAQVAADTPAAAQAAVIAPEPWWKPLISPLFLTVIFIFLTTVITVLVKNRKKDKCLKLLNDYHDGLYSLAPILAGWESARRGGEIIDLAGFMAR